MRAIVCREYGPPAVMRLEEVEKPAPGEKEILIRVRAATVTAGDCEIRRFKIQPLFWLPLRILLGIRRPRHLVLGQELAGVVEATGSSVRRFQPGDEVLASTGIGLGAYADYKCLAEDKAVILKPENISFAEAACLPTGGLNALHFIRLAEIEEGQRVLIIGVSGSIGTIALQLAKRSGAVVTGICSTANVELARSLGADAVIDYTREDFAENDETYDVVLDVAGKSPYTSKLNAVKPGGKLLLTNPKVSEMIRSHWDSRRGDKQVSYAFAGAPVDDLRYLKKLIEAGELRTVIDRCYPLEQAVEAHRYVEGGHKRGNVVVQVEE